MAADAHDGSLLTLVLMKVRVGKDATEWINQIQDEGVRETAKSIADPSHICLSKHWKAAQYYRERYGIK
jgi:hypothetical protein